MWASPGRSQATAEAFYRALGPERCQQLRAVSLDLHGGWITATRAYAPNALICADPFHVIKLCGDALDRVRREAWQELREEDPGRAAFIKGTRFAVRRRAGNLRPGNRTILDELARDNHDIYRGWLVVEQLRAVYEAASHDHAMALLDDWLLAALTSDLDPFHPLRPDHRRPPRPGRQRHHPAPVQCAPGGHEPDGAPAQPPHPRLPTAPIAAGHDHPGVRPDPRDATHLNARRAGFEEA